MNNSLNEIKNMNMYGNQIANIDIDEGTMGLKDFVDNSYIKDDIKMEELTGYSLDDSLIGPLTNSDEDSSDIDNLDNQIDKNILADSNEEIIFDRSL